MKSGRILILLFGWFLIGWSTLLFGATGDGCGNAKDVSPIPKTIANVDLKYQWSSMMSSGRYYYYQFTAPGDGNLHIYSTGADTNTDLKLYEKDSNGNCSKVAQDTSNNKDVDVSYGIKSSKIYVILLYNYRSNNHGNFKLNIDFSQPNSDLSITKTVDNTTPQVNSKVTFTITAKNEGPDASRIRVTDTLPSGLSYYSVSDDKSNFSCSHSGQTVTCEGSRIFSQGESVTITLKATVDSSGTKTNTATAGGSNDPDSSNNSASASLNAIEGTIWIKNSAGDEAYTYPRPYTDNVNAATETLTINGASALDVHIWGEVEYENNCGYDYVTITDNSGSAKKFCGSVDETYRVTGDSVSLLFHSDGGVTKEGVHVKISTAANQTPIANDQNITTYQNRPIDFTLSASDPDGDSLTYTILSQPQHGTLSGNGPDMTYTPEGNYTGSDFFTFNVNDGQSDSNIATVNIEIKELQIVENADDLCYEKPEYSGFMCFDMGICAGGMGCRTTYPLRNTADTPLNDVTVFYDETGLGGSFGSSCGTEPSGTCGTEHDIDFGPVGFFGTATEFDLDTPINPNDESHAIWTQNFAGMSCFNGQYLYGSYIKDGVLHRGKIKPCNYKHRGYRPFTLRYQNILRGDMLTLGNTFLVAPEEQNEDICEHYTNGSYILDAGGANNYYYLCSYYADPHAGFPTTSATLPEILNKNNVQVVWAGLYWQALVENSYDIEQMQIKIRHEDDSDYTSVGYDQLDWVDGDGYTGYISYSAFKDITYLFKEKGWKAGKIYVGDVPIKEGKVPVLGTYGAWNLVIIYADESRKNRAFSIYDGWQIVDDGHQEIDIHIEGFRTSKVTPIHSLVTVFAAEGDKHIPRDYLAAKPSMESDWTLLSHTSDQTFYSAIEVPDSIRFERDPAPINNQGIDIQAFELGDGDGGYHIMHPEEHAIDFIFGSDQDRYWPSMIAFNAELYVPEVCYDYAVKRNEFNIKSDGREYNTTARNGDEISFTIAVRSLEGDLDLNRTSVAIKIEEDKGRLRRENRAYYSEANSNTLIQTEYARGSSNLRPIITIGKGRTKDIGGVLSPDERYFTKFYYEVSSTDESRVEGHFNVELNVTMNFGMGEFWQILPIDQCPQSQIYNPIWYRFNVERRFRGSAPTDPTSRYSLPTRIAGRDFNYSVASYTRATDGEYTRPAAADGVTVDVEMINIGAFDDNQSYFKCSNPDPSIIMMPSRFVHFDNGRDRIYVDISNDLSSTYPVRNATFRMWVLLDENGTVILDEENHPWYDDTYFTQIYNDYFRHLDTLNHCGRYCGGGENYISPRISYDSHAQGCYACLRDFFGQPFCARDNFAIRPAAFRVNIGDHNSNLQHYFAKNSNTTDLNNLNGHDNQVSLVAQYPYLLRADTVDDHDSIIQGYYTDGVFMSETGIASLPDKRNTSYAMIIFKGDSNTCYDKNSTAYSLRFHNGTAENNNTKFHNVGYYTFEMWDSVWTKVDHAYDNPYKTIFDSTCKNSNQPRCNDCRIGIPDNSEDEDEKIGCNIDSIVPQSSKYTELNITYLPDHYRLTFTLERSPSGGTEWIYTNSDITRTIPKPMALEINGTIAAMGALSSTPLSNHIEGCFTDDLTLDLGMLTDRNASQIKGAYHGNDVMASYRLDELNITSLRQSNLADLTDENISLTDFTYHSYNFDPSRSIKGTASLDIYFNFSHRYDDPVNPINVTIPDITVKAINLKGYRDASEGTFIPDGNQSIDQNFTFYYGRAKPSLYFYDNIEGNSTVTPISYQIFCDLLAGCTQYDLNVSADSDQKTNEYDWYLNIDHNSSAGDGTIVLRADHNASVTPPIVTIDGEGIRNDLSVSLPVGVARPVIVNIHLQNSSDQWLIYNKDGVNQIPDPFYRIHFIGGTGAWAGYGETGHVVESNASRIRTRRLEW